jgi:hypothetical protein
MSDASNEQQNEVTLEVDDIIQDHITVKDYKMSFVQFMELSSEVPISRQQWLILIALLESFNACNRTAEAMKNKECRAVALRTEAILDIIHDPSSDILFGNRNGAGALILLEVICGIVEGISTIFTEILGRTKSTKPLPLPELTKKFKSIHKDTSKKIKKGFGAQEAKAVDQISMVVHPILNVEHFGRFLGLLSDSSFVFGFMVHGYNYELESIATADGFVFEPNNKKPIPYFKREQDTELNTGEHEKIFAYANKIGIKPPLNSPDSFESYIVNLRYFLDSVLPLYLNSPLISKRYQKGTERINRLFISYCHTNRQDSIRVQIVNKLDDFLSLAAEDKVSTIVALIKSGRTSQIKSIGKLIGLPSKWTQILTEENLNTIIADFVDIADYLCETHEIEIVSVESELSIDSDEDFDDLSIETIEVLQESIKSTTVTSTRLFSNPLVKWSSNAIQDTRSLTLNSTIRILDVISDMIDHLSLIPDIAVDVNTLMQFGLTPHLFQSSPMITSKRLAIFDSSQGQITAGSLEVRVGAATRLFIESVENGLVISFFGNPDYHK